MKKAELTGLQVVITAISSILGFFVLLGVALYWLVEQSTLGNQAATMILTGVVIFVTIFVVLSVVLFLIWGISKIQQSAAKSNMELMKVNALENQQIMNSIQKGMLLTAQTQKQQAARDIQGAKLVDVINSLQGPQPGNIKFLNGSTSVIDNAFGELDE